MVLDVEIENILEMKPFVFIIWRAVWGKTFGIQSPEDEICDPVSSKGCKLIHKLFTPYQKQYG
jgi:hypothetical protein